MRITLNAALLCIALSGFGLVAVDKAQAVEKSTPASQKKKPKAVPVAQKSKPVLVVKKRAVNHAVAIEHGQDAHTLAVQSGSALVVDLSGGDALYQKNANERTGQQVKWAEIFGLRNRIEQFDDDQREGQTKSAGEQ